jgi:hypothetical protein
VGNWSHAGNWDSGAAPGVTDSVEIVNAIVTSHADHLGVQSINISSGSLVFEAPDVSLVGQALEVRDGGYVVARHTLQLSLGSLEVRVAPLFEVVGSTKLFSPLHSSTAVLS